MSVKSLWRRLIGQTENQSIFVIERQLYELKAQLPSIFLGMALCSFFIAGLVFERASRVTSTIEILFLCFCIARVSAWKRLDIARLSPEAKSRRLERLVPAGVVLGALCSVLVFSFHFGADAGERLALLLWATFCGVSAGMALAVSKPLCRVTMVLCVAPYALFLVATESDAAVKTVALIILGFIIVSVRVFGRIADSLVELSVSESQAEALHSRADATLRTFIESASDWAWERDENNVLTYISPQFAAFCGQSAETLVGKDPRSVHKILKFNMGAVGGVFEDAIASRRAFRDLVYSIQTAAGDEVWLQTSGQPRFSAEGRFTGFVGWTKDITAEVASERRVRDSERRFRDFAESASDWVWETDADNCYSFFSRRASEATGVDHAQFIGTPIAGSFEDADAGERRRLMDALAKPTSFRDVTFRLKAASGETAWIAQSGKPIFDDTKTFRGYRGVARDVTQDMETRRQIDEAHAALEATNARLEYIIEERTQALVDRNAILNEVFETMAEGLLVVDENQRIVARNSKAWKMSKLPEQCWAIGESIVPTIELGVKHGVYEAATAQDYIDNMQADLAAGRLSRTMRRQKDGQVIQEDARLRDCGGVVVTYSDITDMVARQNELERLSEELRHATDSAVAASRAKSDFLANMSHEIRTPMNGVVGMASLLLDSPLTKKQREMAQVIVNSGDNLLKIINDILDFSRLEAGKLRIVNEPFDLRAAVEDVASLLSLRMQEKGLELLVRYQPSLGERFVGDAGRLRQVLTNLVGNAVKFTDNGHIVIAVDGRRRGETASVEIAVTDTGCGIPDDKLADIFDEFEQVDNSSARRFDGAGLGLAITKRIVDAMGGDVTATSAVGRGSTFRVRLTMPIDESAAPARKPQRDMFHDIRGLIVDDNAVNRSILLEQLAAWGITAHAVASGEAALTAAHKAVELGAPYQIAIVDFQMPGMNGVDLAKKFRGDATLALTPLVLLTSAGRKGDPDADVTANFDAYLVKPARASMLLDAVASSLHERSVDQIKIAAAAAPKEIDDTAPEYCRFTADGAPLRVLVAEDNVVNQMVIKAMLEKLGCSVNVAGDGRQAIAAYENSAPDMVLMDLSMPDVDGIEATAAIRRLQEKKGRRTPIIGVTAHALREDRKRCLDAGMDDYLPKPVKQPALEEMLSRWRPDADAAGARTA